MTTAAIYARVSSARQAKDETIGSQLAAVTSHAEQQGLDVPPGWVFTDDGHSGEVTYEINQQGIVSRGVS